MPLDPTMDAASNGLAVLTESDARWQVMVARDRTANGRFPPSPGACPSLQAIAALDPLQTLAALSMGIIFHDAT